MSVTPEELAVLDLSRHCEKHGAYQSKVMDELFGKHMVLDHCMECAKEEREEREAEEAEIKRERLKIARRDYLIRRGISPRYMGASLSTITPAPEQAKVYTSLNSYLESRSVNSLILAGTVGTGKTFLAQALAQDLRERGKDFRFATARQLVRDIRGTWSRDSEYTEEQVIGAYVATDYLFIDEIGMQYGTESEQIAMFDIINGRYENRRPTILITNLDINGLKDIMGERIIDRLRQDGGQMLAFNWKSLRK